ncbi:alpha/beta fold hydrolase [Microbacterium sp. p3-SID336]|uniref:alpha/beta fold hydrolase n=1 Tax=Microbacterium sp. p3-SID336 TaxID=2916212 RepID=UPI0021A824F5|nr:alpha/beta hydrolase [Microbacterium sp. p3-SID336]MCT1476500.1 alpha/beta hydrolase [Microbacterium sp. p3-SID336]
MVSRRRLVLTSGLTFRVLDTPRPSGDSGPTVVLVHGIGMSHRYLSRLHAVLAEHTRVVSIDLPGFGGLPKPPYDLSVERMSRALGAVIATLGDDRVVLVGHSMGAQWAVETALQHPELVRAVVPIGPVVDARHRTLTAQARALAVDTLGETPAINAIVFTDYLRCGVRWYLRQARHMIAYPLEERIALLAVPVLVLRGGADPVAGRAWCRRLRDAATVARLVEVPGRHHVVQQSAPRAVADAILVHTAGPWPTRTGAEQSRGGSVPSTP